MKLFNSLPYCLVFTLSFSGAFAEDKPLDDSSAHQTSETLDIVNVEGESEDNQATELKSREQLNKEMVNNNKDLVRYSTDAGLADNGRNQKGFAVRGVEGNRVNIGFDGVEIPNSEENSLYALYGNFNASRIQIDPELARSIELEKGATSFANGSGSLGGSVNYRSLETFDVVNKEHGFGGTLRSGFNGKNDEWFNTVGAGYVSEDVDTFFLASYRGGHETKSKGEGEYTKMSKSQHPDPSTQRRKNFLFKFNYHFSPEHHVGVGLSHQQSTTFTDERSYTLVDTFWREADDVSKLKTANMYYEWTPDSSITSLKVEYDYQETDLGAIGYKGGKHWRTGVQELWEVYDRRFKTDFHQLSLGAELAPFEISGTEHVLSLKAYANRRNFETLAIDKFGIGNPWEDTKKYTIQYPTQTDQYGITLQDDIVWNDTFTSEIGLRYDYTKIKIKALNADCSDACLGEGKPKGSSFSNFSGFAGVNAQLNETWNIGYQIGTGYRVPSSSELYFSFKNPYGTWKSNRDLKSERSLSHTLAVTADNEIGSLNFNLYHNQYKDFLLEQTTLIEQTRWGRTWQTPVNQMVNINSAKISGIEFSGTLNLDQISSIPEGWSLLGSLGYSKGSLSSGQSLLSIQPLKVVVGLDYDSPDERWGVSSRLSYLAAKKAKDAQVENVKSRCLQWVYDPWFGRDICMKTELYKEIEDFKYLNKPAVVFDLFGYYKPTKNFTLRAGVFNVLDKKYQTWDSLRGITQVGVSNGVDSDGYGLERFYAPGRNFAVSFDYKF